jgi:hypothetical protein
MADITKFKAIFSGLDIAYGTYVIKGERGDGKQNGQATVVRKPPTDDLWERHLIGVEPSLGIIPIRADNTCIWGCIDIDQYPIDHGALVEKIAALQLPLIVCRSKSGGAHCFLFTTEPIPARDMQEYLKACAALLGEAGREIFPKQAEILVDRGDTGNFLNLPYFAGDDGTRYAFNLDGSAATLEEFYALHETFAQTPPLVVPEPPKVAEAPIKDGPPCLQALCSQGFPEGTRNNGLFNVGIYLKKLAPASWEDRVVEHNQKYFAPPLPNNEVQLVIKQLGKKDYRYKCKDAPLNSFLQRWFMSERGGTGSAVMGLIRRHFRRSRSTPVSHRSGSLISMVRRIELETDSLFNQAAFQKACLERLNLLPPTLKKMDWENMLNGLLKEMVETEQISEASEDTSVTGRFMDLLEEFTTHMQQAMDREELLMGRPWIDTEDGRCHFRMKDLDAHLLRNNFKGMTAPKMAQRLRDMGGEPDSSMAYTCIRQARCTVHDRDCSSARSPF